MSIFTTNKKEGKGISKDVSEKTGIALFFEIFFRRFWKLIEINFVYVLFCLPIVTIGPATAGMTKVVKNFSIQRHAYIWTDFFDSFKQNFKKSFFIGIIDIIAIAGMGTGIWLYPDLVEKTGDEKWYILLCMTITMAVIFIIANFYIYLMIVSTELSLKEIVKNAVFLTFIALKKNLVTVLIFAGITAVSVVLAIYYQIFLMLMAFVPASILAFIVAFNCYPIVQKYVINPYYEQKGEINPELEYNKPSEESIFADATETSTTVKEKNSEDEKKVKVKKSKKNKTIS